MRFQPPASHSRSETFPQPPFLIFIYWGRGGMVEGCVFHRVRGVKARAGTGARPYGSGRGWWWAGWGGVGWART